MRYFLLCLFLLSSLYSQTYYYEFDKKIILKPILLKKSDKNTNIKYYLDENNKKIAIISDELIVKCHNSFSCIESINKYDVKSVSSLTKNLFLVKLEQSDDIFEISNILYKDENIEFAIPNSIKKTIKR